MPCGSNGHRGRRASARARRRNCRPGSGQHRCAPAPRAFLLRCSCTTWRPSISSCSVLPLRATSDSPGGLAGDRADHKGDHRAHGLVRLGRIETGRGQDVEHPLGGARGVRAEISQAHLTEHPGDPRMAKDHVALAAGRRGHALAPPLTTGRVRHLDLGVHLVDDQLDELIPCWPRADTAMWHPRRDACRADRMLNASSPSSSSSPSAAATIRSRLSPCGSLRAASRAQTDGINGSADMADLLNTESTLAHTVRSRPCPHPAATLACRRSRSTHEGCGSPEGYARPARDERDRPVPGIFT